MGQNQNTGHLRPEYDEGDLNALQDFACTVWGNDTAFKTNHVYHFRGEDRTVKCLDFGEHFHAVQILQPSIQNTKFLVRKEYKIAMHELRTYHGKGAYITGQPGIGKTHFLIYALIHRLRHKHPVAFQLDAKFYALFSETGVTIHPHTSKFPLQDGENVWALSDSNDVVTSPAVGFLTTPKICVIQTTPPESKRWKEWSEQKRVLGYIMDIWPTDETVDLASLLGLNVEHMFDLATAWGGIPRRLLDLFNSPTSESEFESSLSAAAFRIIAASQTEAIIQSLTSLDVETSASFFLFVIKPIQELSGRIYHQWPAVYVPTSRILDILAASLRYHDEHIRMEFLEAMKSVKFVSHSYM